MRWYFTIRFREDLSQRREEIFRKLELTVQLLFKLIILFNKVAKKIQDVIKYYFPKTSNREKIVQCHLVTLILKG